MKKIAIVLAGGVGARVGADQPKQFIKVLGKPIMIYTLETFDKNDSIDEIVLVCLSTHMDLAKQYCREYNISKISSFVEGGKDFIHSCINGMNSLKGNCEDDDIVLITSADRPFTTNEEIDGAIKVCKIYGSGIPARKCSLCMFEKEKGKKSSSRYLRDSLVQTATPWAFSYRGITDALDKYEKGRLTGCESYPVSIYAAAGNEVYFSESDPNNIKITEKYDVMLMESILKEQKG